MKNLTQHQIDFLLEYFFKHPEFSGWKNIATKLILNGKCIVGNVSSLWNGGIGNFIKVGDCEEGYDVYEYTFDLKYFLGSAYFIEIYSLYIKELENDKKKFNKKFDDILNINL
jgi:hypothetical protein